MKLNYISHVFKNNLTGEIHIAKNKVMAWLYFFDKDTDKPTMDDIIQLNHDK